MSQSGTPETVILIAEDEPIVLEFVSHVLQNRGYTLLRGSNGKEALHLAQAYAGRIHLLLTDVMMPEMSGPALARQLTASAGQDIQVLMMSGYDQDVLALEKSWSFIRKPFSAQDLLAEVQQLLSQPQSKEYTTAGGQI